MKRIINFQIGFAFLLAVMPVVSKAATLNYSFNDVFTGGSTANSNPTAPFPCTTTNTAYEEIASKGFAPAPPSISPNDFKWGIVATSSGSGEVQALFDTNQVALTEPGDFIQLTIVFTNTSGGLAFGNSLLFCGLYNSSQVPPAAGGLNNEATGTLTDSTGGAQNWVGYNSYISYENYKDDQINTRPAQAGTSSISQELLINSGLSSGGGYTGANAVGTAGSSASSVALTAGNPYTVVLTITENGTQSEAITNALYSGTTATGTPLGSFGAIATNANFITAGFDAFAFGLYNKASSGPTNTFDISSITVTSSVTVVSGPPNITLQPVPVTVVTNATAAFVIDTTGFGQTYQWSRNNTNLLDQGNISGATGDGNSSILVISNATTADALASANGYWALVTGAGGYTTNSFTNSLTLVPGTNLVWTAAHGASWDFTTLNWEDTNGNPQVFTFGDNVTFNNVGGGGTVTLNGPYLSAGTITVSNTTGRAYTFSGSGSIAGPSTLLYDGSQQLTLNNVNSFTGGTIISNSAAYLYLENYGGLGNGPLILALGQTPPSPGMEVVANATTQTTGWTGDLIVNTDFAIQYDNLGSYDFVVNGGITGTPGMTLTFVPDVGVNDSSSDTTTNNRIRVYGADFTNNVNIDLSDSMLVYAPYNSSGVQVYNGAISGPGAYMEKGVNDYLMTANSYSGGTYLVTGSMGVGNNSALGSGPLYMSVDSTSVSSSSGTLFAVGSSSTIANTIEYPSGTNNTTLVIGGPNNLTFSSAFSLAGNDNLTTNIYTARTFQVTNGVVGTFSGVISDLTNGVSARYGLTLSGVGGVLVLGNTETYMGPTVISNATLRVNGALNAASAVTVLTNGALAGSGTVNGPVTIEAAGALAPGGATIGALTINNGVTNAGNISVRVNRSGFISDNAVVSGALTNIGTGNVIVTNLGAALQTGDTFTLFNKPLTNGAAMGVYGGNVAWINNLAVNGSIQVAASGPDIGVSVVAPASVAPAANLTNTITVTNIGPGSAYDMIVTDMLPANATFVSATGGGTTNVNAGQVVWTISSLAIDTFSNLTLVEKAGASGNVVNTASGISAALDPNPANNTSSATTVISSVIIPTLKAHLGSFNINSTNVVITATNGVNGGTYYLLESTNLGTPIGQWIPVSTNVVSASGGTEAFTFNGTNVVTPNGAQQFYILSNTNN